MNRHCIITGGSSGIGLAAAQQLVKKGYSLSLIARRQQQLEVARQTLEPLRLNADQQIALFSANVADRDRLNNVSNEAVEQLGPPSLVITSAGIAEPGYFRDLSTETFESSMQINYLGTVYTIKALLPHMESHGGNILMVSSGAGLIGIFGYTAYSPTKFALRGFAEALQAELRNTKIGVSIAYPPDTDTPQLAHENLTKPAETKIMTETAGVWSADKVAEIMLKGVEQGRFAITPGVDLTLLNRLGSLVNPLLQRYWAWQTRHLKP